MTHQELIDSAASYALDALDPEERSQFESHLADCVECQTEVAAYREVAGALAYATPSIEPARSDALRERILRDAGQVRPISSAPRVVAADVAPARARPPIGVWSLTAAALAASIVLGVFYRSARTEADRLRDALAVAQETLAHDDSVLAAFVGPEVHVVSLAVANQKPAVRVFWNHTRHMFVVTAMGLPPAPSGKTYQLWAIRKGQPPMSMGTFDPAATGRTLTTIAVAQPITDGGFIDDCALTVEPVGGSPQPTETPRMVGSWRHVD